MNEFSFVLQRASLFGLAALAIALGLQWVLAERVPASWRVWVWRVALIQGALALVPLAPIAIAILPARAPVAAPIVESPVVPEPPIAQAPPAQAPPAQAPPVAALKSAPPVTTPPLQTPAPSSAPANEADYLQIQLGWRGLLVWIYAFGIAAQLLLLARNARRVRRVLRVCTPLENARLNVVATRLGIGKTPRLLQSDGGSPFLTGILRPTIVLPRTLSTEYLDAILAHELAHHKRRDLAWNALLWALQTLLWFHPLTFAARRFHALEVESACDELTLQLTKIAPKSYGALLLHSMNKHSSPLTAGVNDGFFALQTRLKRLGQKPANPRRRMRWLFGAALLLSFVAVLPIGFRARAQSEANATTELSGTVKNASGQAVAGATVYLMKWRDSGGLPLETVVSDAAGRYRFSDERGEDNDIVVFADVGARGMGQSYFWQHGRDLRVSNPIINPLVPVKLLLVTPDGKRAANMRVRVGQLGGEVRERWSLPRSVGQSLQTLTNARGEAVFAGLPHGQIAQFYLADHKFRETNYGVGDLRGGQYAPLAWSDAVKVGDSRGWKTIRLVPPVQLRGRVTTPDGAGKSGVLVVARRINAAEASGDYNGREMLIPQTRTDASGNYKMDGLRPGLYRIELHAEKTWRRDYVAPVALEFAEKPINTVNLPLVGGGLVKGVLVNKVTQTPLARQEMGLLDARGELQYTTTGTDGTFGFRTLPGDTWIWVAIDGYQAPLRVINREFTFQLAEMKLLRENTNAPRENAPRENAPLQLVATMKAQAVTRRSNFLLKTPIARAQSIAIGAEAAVSLPVRAGVTREIIIESTLQPKFITATLSGRVTLPSGAGQSAVVMVRPATDAGFANAIQKPTDARGRYTINGLKPGIYKITALLDDVAKTKWAAPSLNQSLAPGANRADFALTPGALIEGVVWTQSTHRPIAGIEVLTADPDGDGTIVKTDIKGHFEFRVAPGPVAVRVHDDATPPPKLSPTPISEFRINAQNGQRFRVVFELPEAARN